jgi:hypothetical protein
MEFRVVSLRGGFPAMGSMRWERMNFLLGWVLDG